MKKYRLKGIYIYDSLKKKLEFQYFICFYDQDNPELLIPSIFTGFIHKYSLVPYTQKSLASNIIPFLNYTIEQVVDNTPLFTDLKMQGIAGINLYHVAQYLNYISTNSEMNLKKSTVQRIEKNIIRLLYYLNDTGLNHNNTKILEKAREANQNIINTYQRRISPFQFCPDIYIHYPQGNYVTKNVLKNMREEVWDLFVEFAEEYYPIIAFGLVLMICSGIRVGECVNLRVKDIKYDRLNDCFYTNIHDHQEELFFDRGIDLSSSQVKKPRDKQPILPIYSRIGELYSNHLERLKIAYKTNHISNKALFVNANNNSMSGNSFRNYFSSLKKDFIQFLQDESLEETAELLSSYKWGAHIGRHIFTNTIVKSGYANGSSNRPIPRLVALLRGDSTEEASMGYIDEATIASVIKSNMDDISNIAGGYGGKLNEEK
ncbi:hypothetical protein lbkm_1099 [Lachnospiraceae bacterium KM106-2]|nr:hypothetical protein lbkm_1099 [Lachnospiraceae bacterium KM106-2]